MPQAGVKRTQRPALPATLGALRNIGAAMLADFKLLGVTSVSQLAEQDVDELYTRLCLITGVRQDPCVHDTFAAAIHQARTGEALNWWAFTALRKERQRQGRFPMI
jgi:hypothetical protein